MLLCNPVAILTEGKHVKLHICRGCLMSLGIERIQKAKKYIRMFSRHTLNNLVHSSKGKRC